jgi:hypothetical protein
MLRLVARLAIWAKSAISARGRMLAQNDVAPQRGLQRVIRQIFQALRPNDYTWAFAVPLLLLRWSLLLPLVESGGKVLVCRGRALAPATYAAQPFAIKTERLTAFRSIFWGGPSCAALRRTVVALLRPAMSIW